MRMPACGGPSPRQRTEGIGERGLVYHSTPPRMACLLHGYSGYSRIGGSGQRTPSYFFA